MSKDPRSLHRPVFESASMEHCSKCGYGEKKPHLKTKALGDNYERSYCLVCRPELLDAPDNGRHPYENLDRWETRRLIRTRDRNLGKGLRVVLKGDGATSVEALLAHFAKEG